MAESPYNDKGYFRGGLRDPAQQRHLADQPGGEYRVRGNLPRGFLVVEQFLTPAQCKRIVAYAADQTGMPSTVQAQGSGAARANTRSHTRVTDYIPIGELVEPLTGFMRNVFVDLVQSHYGERIVWFEQPEILRYRPGGHYAEHVDAENWDAARRRWVPGVDRHYSLLLYLNGEFTGGELDFPNFGLRLRPKPGMLVLFPSDHRYVHAARPVTSGLRYALVCWGVVSGRELIDADPPPGATVIPQPDES